MGLVAGHPNGQLDEAAFHRDVAVIADEILSWPMERRSGREAIERLGGAGLLAARWSRRDDVLGVALIEALARRGLSSTAVVVSLHGESVLAMLRQFGHPDVRLLCDAAVSGRRIGCIAASEPDGGSDLTSVGTTARPVPAGWRITGDKKFVTLAPHADFAVVLARADTGAANSPLGAFVVPRDGFEIVRTHRLVAGSPLDTSWIRVDATVPHHHLLGRAGLGLVVINHGLTKERLAIVALVVGVCRLALTLAVTHASERHQFGRRLLDHQAIRLRLAQLDAQLHTIDSDLRHVATQRSASRRVAGLKATAAQFGERCLSECMHVFGGIGYLEDETPLGRLWRDVRLARIGGGTDELMWEIAAPGLRPDLDTYRRFVGGPSLGVVRADSKES